ncbi:MAG: haloacid dehalogenase [Proteobacteria bacterium]|nr:haloacid dehalogenase [Pseudomonadota bacterium]
MELEEIAGRIRERFERSERVRERVLALHREAIRASGLAIRALHRGDFDEARGLVGKAGATLDQVHQEVAEHPQVYHAGYVHDAQKEFAEASLTLALVTDAPLPSPEALRVEDAAWLNGLAESVGELRRYILDRLRQREVGPSETLLARMDEIYSMLTSMDYPDALTRGLRRSTDVARGCIEKTRGDLTHHVSMRDLEERLDRLRAL